MTRTPPTAWFVVAALIALCAVPVIGGAVRLVTVAMGIELIPGHERFFAAPLSVTIHILSVSVFCVFGAFQVSSPVRRRNPARHRRAGRVLVPVGTVAALSGLWLTLVYPPGDLDGPTLFAFRIVFGSAMIGCLWLGFLAIRQRDFAAHRAWMIRAFAIALGAGTQVFTHMPLSLFPDLNGETGRTLAMGGGWALNLLIAEWIIRRPRNNQPAAALALS